MSKTDPDPDWNWMKTEPIGGYPWWVLTLCTLMILGTIGGLIVNWLVYR